MVLLFVIWHMYLHSFITLVHSTIIDLFLKAAYKLFLQIAGSVDVVKYSPKITIQSYRILSENIQNIFYRI